MNRPQTFLGACLDGIGFGAQLAAAAIVGWYGANGAAWVVCRLIGVPFHFMAMP